MCILCFFAFSGFSFVVFFLQYFDTVGWVFRPVKTVSHITYRVYCVDGGDVKPTQSINPNFSGIDTAATLREKLQLLGISHDL